MRLQDDWDDLIDSLRIFQRQGGNISRLARRSGVARMTIHQWLRGGTPKTITVGQAVADVLKDGDV